MKDVSRRGLLSGAFFRRDDADPLSATAGESAVRSLLRASRVRPPWERSATSATPTGKIVLLTADQCLVSMGTFCSTCVERCPVAGALTWDGDGRPSVDPSLCTGCGDCVQACPAPQRALGLVELRVGR